MAQRPHISRAQRHLARSVLDDAVAITRPPASVERGSLDPVTLQYSNLDPEPVWTGCAFVNLRPAETGGQWRSIEALGRLDLKARVRLPVECPQLYEGDLITVTASETPQLIDTVLTVIEDGIATRQITKVVMCRVERRTDA